MVYEVNIPSHNMVWLKQKLWPKMYRIIEIKKEFSKYMVQLLKCI